MAANKLTALMNSLRPLYAELEAAQRDVDRITASPNDDWETYESATIRLDDARNAILNVLDSLSRG